TMRVAPSPRSRAEHLRPAHELTEKRDAVARPERRVERVRDAQDGGVHEDLDMLAELVAVPEGRLEVGIARRKPRPDAPARRARRAAAGRAARAAGARGRGSSGDGTGGRGAGTPRRGPRGAGAGRAGASSYFRVYATLEAPSTPALGHEVGVEVAAQGLEPADE